MQPRTDIALPKVMKSRTEELDPNCDIPKTENELPSRARLRSEYELPKLEKSSNDKPEPMLVNP
jgi:hypothetical protein